MHIGYNTQAKHVQIGIYIKNMHIHTMHTIIYMHIYKYLHNTHTNIHASMYTHMHIHVSQNIIFANYKSAITYQNCIYIVRNMFIYM